MSYLFLLLSFLFIAQPKDSKPGKGLLSIRATGQIMLPADKVQFDININAEAKSPKVAYNLHQKREQALVDLLDKYDIKEKNIHYQPVSIRKNTHHIEGNHYDTTYVTRQSVSLELSNFDLFEKIQIGLIENDYDSFSAHFTSSKMDDGKDRALKAAMEKARRKAELIAKEAGVNLGDIKRIEFRSSSAPQPVRAYQMKASSASSGSLLKYDQSIPVEATVSIKYAISNE